MIDLDELEVLRGRCTAGPWVADVHGRACDCLGRVVTKSGEDVAFFPEVGVFREEPSNIKFVAEVYNAMPAIIRELRAARELFGVVDVASDGRTAPDAALSLIRGAVRDYRKAVKS